MNEVGGAIKFIILAKQPFVRRVGNEVAYPRYENGLIVFDVALTFFFRALIKIYVKKALV
jgi:hypothetical protein